MNGTSQGWGDLYSVIWIMILDPDSRYRPTKTISPVGMGQEHAPGLSLCLYGFSVWIRLVCYGFRACRNTSTTGRAKNVPDPTSCCDGHYDLSVTLPFCCGFHNRLGIFTSFFPQPYDFCNGPALKRRIPR